MNYKCEKNHNLVAFCLITILLGYILQIFLPALN